MLSSNSTEAASHQYCSSSPSTSSFHLNKASPLRKRKTRGLSSERAPANDTSPGRSSSVPSSSETDEDYVPESSNRRKVSRGGKCYKVMLALSNQWGADLVAWVDFVWKNCINSTHFFSSDKNRVRSKWLQTFPSYFARGWERRKERDSQGGCEEKVPTSCESTCVRFTTI